MSKINLLTIGSILFSYAWVCASPISIAITDDKDLKPYGISLDASRSEGSYNANFAVDWDVGKIESPKLRLEVYDRDESIDVPSPLVKLVVNFDADLNRRIIAKFTAKELELSYMKLIFSIDKNKELHVNLKSFLDVSKKQ